jgi:hypothetical protein
MFVTDPSFEDLNPRALGGHPDARYWIAATLTLHTPFFMLTWTAATTGYTQTILIAWERVLISLITQMPARAVQSIRVLFSDNRTFAWQMLPVLEIWLPLPDEEELTGQLLMRLQGHTRLVDVYLRNVDDRPGRQLLIETREHRDIRSPRSDDQNTGAEL